MKHSDKTLKCIYVNSLVNSLKLGASSMYEWQAVGKVFYEINIWANSKCQKIKCMVQSVEMWVILKKEGYNQKMKLIKSKFNAFGKHVIVIKRINFNKMSYLISYPVQWNGKLFSVTLFSIVCILLLECFVDNQ